MNPFFFGSSRKQLFGVHHPPKTDSARKTAVLLCYPFGDEYMRTHKAVRQLTLHLAKVGFHLLRFDYFATGDSAGESEDGTIDQWIEDISVAADELKDTSGLTSISVVGLRLGATLATEAVATRTDVEELVLWDPIVRGTAYFDELMLPPPFLHDAPPAPPPKRGETAGALGYPVTPALRAGLERLDLTAKAVPGPRRVSLVVSHEREDYTSLKDHLQQRPAFHYQHVASPAPWIEPEKNGGAMVLPHEIIQAIVSKLSGSDG
jgi:alpha/beta superfamily hydrolase